jgi:outer membrane immunogenic protein
MRNLLFAGAAACALLTASSASAADVGPIRKGPPPMASFVPFSWNGFYFGVNAGYGFKDDNEVTVTGRDPVNVTSITGGARPASVDLDPDGFIGGGQIGYNWQFGAFVYGVETDIQYAKFASGRTITTPSLGGADALNNTFWQELEYFGTFRARVGIAADRTLYYVTGGFAYGGTDNNVTFTSALPAGATQYFGRRKHVDVGYSVGAGVEYAFANNMSVRAEYLYFNLGRGDPVSVNPVPFPTPVTGSGYDASFKTDGHLLRGGFNWRFSAMPALAPVLSARY